MTSMASYAGTLSRYHEGLVTQPVDFPETLVWTGSSCAAYFRRSLPGPMDRARVQVSTLRLLKLGAWIESSVRRIVLHLPIDTPLFRRLAAYLRPALDAGLNSFREVLVGLAVR